MQDKNTKKIISTFNLTVGYFDNKRFLVFIWFFQVFCCCNGYSTNPMAQCSPFKYAIKQSNHFFLLFKCSCRILTGDDTIIHLRGRPFLVIKRHHEIR